MEWKEREKEKETEKREEADVPAVKHEGLERGGKRNGHSVFRRIWPSFSLSYLNFRNFWAFQRVS